MPLVNCEINLILCWTKNKISSATGKIKFAIINTTLYVLVITSLTEDNIKLFKQLESDFKRIINWSI